MAPTVMLIRLDSVRGPVLYDCPRLHPSKVYERGRELMPCFREYGERHGARFHEHGRPL